MSNGKVCCLLGVCCPPGSAAQRRAFVEELAHDGITSPDAERIGTWVLANFDLAPKGTLEKLKADVAAMARRVTPDA